MTGRLALFALLLILAGCGGSSSTSGPTRDAIVIEAEDLGPFGIGGACVVRVTFRTRDEAILRLVIRWRALNAAGRELGDAVLVLFNLPPGSHRQEDSTHFSMRDTPGQSVPCSAISRFERFLVDIT